MKRTGASGAAAKKAKRSKTVQRAASDDTAAGADQRQQQRPVQQQRAAAPVSAAQFDVAAWAGGEALPADLAAEVKQQLKAALEPSEDGCWRFVGAPMNKAAVLAHYDERPGFFQSGISTLSQLQRLQEQHERGEKQFSRKQEQMALFHFEGVRMDDEDEGDHWEVRLGDYVIIPQEVTPFHDRKTTVKEELIGRVTEIFVTLAGERMVSVHWMYRDVDTPIAVNPGERAQYGKTRPDTVEYQRELPVGGNVSHPRRLWLCGSVADNVRYQFVYGLSEIDRPVRVFHVAPGITDPSDAPELAGSFDSERDWFYNQYTVRDFMTFEDCYEDWLPWSPRYQEAWATDGVDGIKRLKGNKGSAGLTGLMRGAGKKQLRRCTSHRKLHVMELFCGGGGLSYICQRNDAVTITASWANDINNSAAATYSANHPSAYMSAVGLEEYTQLCMKWGCLVDAFLGDGWRAKLPDLVAIPPGKRFSRQHMPRGVGCFGSTVGVAGSSAQPFVEAAELGQQAVQEALAAEPGLRDEAVEAVEEPDWDELLSRLDDVEEVSTAGPGDDEDGTPLAPGADALAQSGGEGDVPGESAAQRKARKAHEQRIQEAFAKAVQVQRDRVQECRDRVEEQELGEVVEVRDVRITDCAVRVTQGSSKNQLDEILTDWECWVEFEVLRESAGEDGWAWEHHSLLRTAVEPVRRFMLRMLADKTIPMPGDVQLLTGGPPCQNVSGLNRHAKQEAVLNDPKNRLVTSYMNIIRYLRPNFILMEQVTDVFRKEQAVYARYTLMQMIALNYQARSGICTAGSYGVPQGRKRALFWGARSGEEQLPPFPLPSHNCKEFWMSNPKAAEYCVVQLEQSQLASALPMALMGDALSDLPPISNFEEGDRKEYASEPQYVLQAYLRRGPAAHSRCLELRSVHADAAMAPYQWLAGRAQAIRDKGDKYQVLAVGQRVLCKKGGPPRAPAAAAAAAAAGKKGAKGKAGKAAAAASASASGSGAAAAGDDDDEDDMAAAAAAVAAGDDGGDEDEADGETAEERAVLADELRNSKNFAKETWQANLRSVAESEGEVAAELLSLIRDAELHNTTQHLGELRLKLLAEAEAVPATAPLRDHRPLLCNSDDWARMRAVPREKGANFRDMPGVVTNPDGRCCAGSWHAAQRASKGAAGVIKENVAAWRQLSKEQQEAAGDPTDVLYKGVELVCSCRSAQGGMPPKPPKGWKGVNGNDKHFRVDSYGSTKTKSGASWRGIAMEGCDSRALFISTGDLVCPRWCVTYKDGKSNGRHGCYGRIWQDQIQPTVVTRAEPHNLELIHPQQDRVLSIRENARCQGFPDHHVFLGLAAKGKSRTGHGKGTATVDERYLQIGNAVAPPLAAALGRCLLLACEEEAPVAAGVAAVPDPEYAAAAAACEAAGIKHYCQTNPVDLSKGNQYYWARHNASTAAPAAAAAATAAAAAAAEEEGQVEEEQQQEMDEEMQEAADLAAAAAAVAAAARRKQQQKKRKNAPAAGAAAGGDKQGEQQQQAKKKKRQSKGAAAAAAAGPDEEQQQQAVNKKNKQASSGSAAAVAAEGGGAAAASKGKKGAAAGASGGGKKAAAAGLRQSSRSAAAAASAAIRQGAQLEATPLRKLKAVAVEQQEERQLQRARRLSVAASAELPQQLRQEVAGDDESDDPAGSSGRSSAEPLSPVEAAAAGAAMRTPVGAAAAAMAAAAVVQGAAGAAMADTTEDMDGATRASAGETAGDEAAAGAADDGMDVVTSGVMV